MRIRFMRTVLLAVGMLLMSAAAAFAQVSISVAVAPPELPVYEQPVCPGDGYIWTPGYWAWDGDDYYWVPGTWVEAPEVGFLWTPGYWGWGGSAFIFHAGFWGPTVGFYGGVNYGFGYFGHGFEGGRWEGGHFFYNRAVANVNVTIIHNVYETRVNETRVMRISYNGGRGGIDARPSREEEAAEHERHIGAVEAQTRHVEEARSNRELRASVNHGRPPIAATARPGDFKGREVVPAREGGADHRNTAVHPKELPPAERRSAPNTGNPKVDKKYQQQQEKLSTRQDQERQKLQQKQDQDHQRLQQQKANDERQRQVEQKHQQQTEQLQQRHTQQQQKLEQRQQPAHKAAAPKDKR